MSLASAFLVPLTQLKIQAGTPVQLLQNENGAATVDIAAVGHASTTKLSAIAALGAGAFLAGRSRSRHSAAAMRRDTLKAFENELGVQAPVGFFDPLGFCKDGDVVDFKRRRESELKNGRVAMFAAMGYITPEYYKLPGYLSPSSNLKFVDVPNGLAALGKVPTEGWLQIIALCGFYELVVNQPQNPSEPGNYGRGQLGFTGQSISDPQKRARSLNSELANGRLAMVAIMGMIFQNGFIGSTGPEMWIPGAALASKAFEKELGVQAPVGFFDPFGFCKDGDVGDFKRRRESELKNGRVAMFAAMGYITPEYYKLPGYLSPSSNLKFADVPNGLAALGKVPTEGWLQIIALCGFYELVVNQPQNPQEPGNYGRGQLGFTGKSISDPEKRARSLNSELANGRLAMVAIMGMIFQNGVIGSTGPDMWIPGGAFNGNIRE